MTLPKALEELKTLPQWVGYSLKWDEDKGKNKKLPFCPVHAVLQYVDKSGKPKGPKEDKYGKGAAANCPESWGTYDQAIQLMNVRRYINGVGFEFASGYAGIDIDHCIDENGKIHPVAAEIVQVLDSYTEISPSGTGLHIVVKTNLEPIRGRRTPIPGTEGVEGKCVEIEMYNTERFFTVTGRIYGQEKPINERTAQFQQIHDKYMPKRTTPAERPKNGSTGQTRFSDSTEDIWAKMFNSKHGAEIQALYKGNIPGRLQTDGEGQSRADLALCSHLAFWTNGNTYMMDKMFRESGLYRDKWEREDYREWTLSKALEGNNSNSFNQSLQSNNNLWARDRNGNIIEADERLEQEGMKQTALRVKFEESKQPDSIEDYANNLFNDELENFRKNADRKTGFQHLDKEMGSLYPGLYAVGAISSLGKTTFLHQIADQLAENGEHVLFFSLEQSRLELFSKGVARQSIKEAWNAHRKEGYEAVRYYAVSAIKVRTGLYNDRVIDLPALTKRYAQIHGNVSIIECGFDTKIGDITGYVEKYIEANQVKPVVIIDYLQIIQPDDTRQAKKDIVDSHVRALKMLQKDNDLIMFLICSLNRGAYLTPVDFESFKETGGIEYTADVVWGLDLHVMETNSIFDKQESKKQKRDAIKAAKLEIPRRIDLKCLKNRYGKSSYTAYFNYYPENDYFESLSPAFSDFEMETDANGKEIAVKKPKRL